MRDGGCGEASVGGSDARYWRLRADDDGVAVVRYCANDGECCCLDAACPDFDQGWPLCHSEIVSWQGVAAAVVVADEFAGSEAAAAVAGPRVAVAVAVSSPGANYPRCLLSCWNSKILPSDSSLMSSVAGLLAAAPAKSRLYTQRRGYNCVQKGS